MCVNYVPVPQSVLDTSFDATMEAEAEWEMETWQDYPAPIILASQEEGRRAVVASYGMIPKTRIAPGTKRFSSMNARAETIGQLRSFAASWQSCQLCLVPMTAFFEPNYESGLPVRWKIGMQDDSPFAVAGLYRTWREENGTISYSFTQITINADDHPLMKRFHKPDDEKRSLVIVPVGEYDDWLNCRSPELARSFLSLFPAQTMKADAAPKPVQVQAQAQASLFD